MKSNLLPFSRYAIAVPGLLFGLMLLPWAVSGEQNHLKNPNFEEPLGPDNWTVEYAGIANPITASYPSICGPNDFEVKGRTRHGHKDKSPGTWDGEFGGQQHYWNKFGGHFRAGHDWLMHAYLKQVVTGLQAGASYTVSCWMTQFQGPANKAQIYLEVLGGADGTTAQFYPPASTLADPTDAGYLTNSSWNNPANWAFCVVTNTASDLGQLEVRLHYNKRGSTTQEKWRNMDAFYDHAAVVLTGEPLPPPPFQILSLTHSNQNVTFNWQTALNNTYRIQVTSDLANPGSWKDFLGPYPWQDPDFLAPGASMTFTTNVVANSLGNPYYDPNLPLFFRVVSKGYNPKPW